MKLSFPTLLATVFITLKLLQVIDWSWTWVLSPLWFPFSLILLYVLVKVINKQQDNGK